MLSARVVSGSQMRTPKSGAPTKPSWKSGWASERVFVMPATLAETVKGLALSLSRPSMAKASQLAIFDRYWAAW